jgi:hypothetical protein
MLDKLLAFYKTPWGRFFLYANIPGLIFVIAGLTLLILGAPPMYVALPLIVGVGVSYLTGHYDGICQALCSFEDRLRGK